MKKIVLKSVGIFIILIGILFIFSKPLKNYSMGRISKTYGIETINRELIKKNETAKATFDFDKVKSIDTAAIAKGQAHQLARKQLPVIAGIAIPSVNIRLPIFKGLANDNLLYGAGTLSETQKMGVGNYALASHRSDQPDLLFTPLENMLTGEKIYITDLDKVYVYEVSVVKKVDPSSVEVLDYKKGIQPMITLLTCGDLYAQSRIVVQGTLVQTMPTDDMTKEIADAFNLPIKSY